MRYLIEKPGTPEELVHYGVKGMKWGVRKSSSSSGKAGKSMSTRKKVAIGAGTVALVAGSAFVAYKLNQAGSLPVSPLSNRHPSDVKRLLEENGNVKLSSREWKRYSRLAAADREQAARMQTTRIEAGRRLAKKAKG
jgi:hypothetical protein